MSFRAKKDRDERDYLPGAMVNVVMADLAFERKLERLWKIKQQRLPQVQAHEDAHARLR